MELHERIDAKVVQKEEKSNNAVFLDGDRSDCSFGCCVFLRLGDYTQSVWLKHLSVMMIAVIIAVGIMLWSIESLDGICQQTSDREVIFVSA